MEGDMPIAGEMPAGDRASEVMSEDTMEDGAEMDMKVAAILHLQQLQQKQEVMQLLEAHPVTNADTEFRMQLDELVRDHLTTCMALASCSTTHNNGSGSPPFGLRGDSSDSHHHVLDQSAEQYRHHHHQYHLAVDNEDEEEHLNDRIVQQSRENPESSSHPLELMRPETGILGRWDERQGSEPTLMERQVREAELLALSSMHTVSALDASFLEGSQIPRTESFVERPQRVSPLVQMWRELEGEQREREANHLFERIRTRDCDGGESQNWRDCEEEHECEMQRPEATGIAESGTSAETDNLSYISQEGENGISGPRLPMAEEAVVNAETFTEDIGNTLERDTTQSSDVEMLDGERERVRRMVRRWMRDRDVDDSEAGVSAQSRSRAEWLSEGERERVRQMARDWVQVSNFQSTAGPSQSLAVHPLNMARQFQPANGRQEVSPGDSDQSQQNWIRGDDERQREVVMELRMRSEQERQRELEGISEHRTVSAFAHRSRLQSFLRGRFLRSGFGTDENRPPSLAAGEIRQLRQRHAVSGLREGFRFRLENIVRGQNNQGQQGGPRFRQGTETVLQGGSPRRQDLPTALQSLEDATAYNMELRELLARQSVTTMLASEFRDRLDQLIRSFMQAQGRTPQPWNTTRMRQGTLPSQQEQVPLRDPRGGESRPNDSEPAEVPPPPPLPPNPQPLRQPVGFQQSRAATWARHTPQRSQQMEWETTSRGLRSDVSVIQRGMHELQEMMEASIQMQLELQRSVKQEIAGALQRMYIGKELPAEALDGSKWTSVKKGTCCICCDKQIDCLLYRCGHMCTCVNCASELRKESGRCPMCRASIVEYVRAFTVA